MPKTPQRKELIAQYKQTVPKAGVYRILNKKNGKFFLSSSLRIDSVTNKFEFAKKVCSYEVFHQKISRELKKDGFDSFSVEILELLKITPEMTGAEIREELKILEELWREKLGTDEEY